MACLFLCRSELISDKGGIKITSVPESTNGKVVFNIDLMDKAYVVKFHIANEGQNCIHFSFYTALHRMRCFTLVDERRVSRVCPLLLCPGEERNSERSCTPPVAYADENNGVMYYSDVQVFDLSISLFSHAKAGTTTIQGLRNTQLRLFHEVSLISAH